MTGEFAVAVHSLVFLNHMKETVSSEVLAKMYAQILQECVKFWQSLRKEIWCLPRKASTADTISRRIRTG